MAVYKRASVRKEELIKAGLRLVKKVGARNVTRRALAEAAKCSEPLVNKHIGSVAEMRKTLAAAAAAGGISEPSQDKQDKIARAQRMKSVLAKGHVAKSAL